ncbi:MAG: hypothetical protein EOP10_29685 [Proteobacteria bacterium]|nr:MAG: hypothetical protein EOP10_29685 [Pseudomonadota bacterium]
MRLSKAHQKLFLFALGLTLSSCQSVVKLETRVPVQVPYIRNSANECYYLDEFMPVPDNLVSGESGAMKLRYYTYNVANYKDWDNREIILSFYSRDDKCWSLFEEFYLLR